MTQHDPSLRRKRSACRRMTGGSNQKIPAFETKTNGLAQHFYVFSPIIPRHEEMYAPFKYHIHIVYAGREFEFFMLTGTIKSGLCWAFVRHKSIKIYRYTCYVSNTFLSVLFCFSP